MINAQQCTELRNGRYNVYNNTLVYWSYCLLSTTESDQNTEI